MTFNFLLQINAENIRFEVPEVRKRSIKKKFAQVCERLAKNKAQFIQAQAFTYGSTKKVERYQIFFPPNPQIFAAIKKLLSINYIQ